jgi:isoleucyl-tRNA synthetase
VRAFEAYVDDLSNWYIRRSRRRFWNGEETALRILWTSLVQALRVIAPVTPFLAEHLWQALVVSVSPTAPASIFLADWPPLATIDEALLADVCAVRKVVDLGRRARVAAGLRLRQPLRRLVIEGVDGLDRYLDQIADELRVREAVTGRIDATQLRVRPNLPVVGRRLGRDVPAVRNALGSGEFRELDAGRFEVAGHVLEPEEVLVERLAKDGWAVAAEDGVTVAIDITLDDHLLREGRVYEVIHQVNKMRKDAGLAITDRISLWLPLSDTDLLEHREWIAAETLAVSVAVSADEQVRLSPV